MMRQVTNFGQIDEPACTVCHVIIVYELNRIELC